MKDTGCRGGTGRSEWMDGEWKKGGELREDSTEGEGSEPGS